MKPVILEVAVNGVTSLERNSAVLIMASEGSVQGTLRYP